MYYGETKKRSHDSQIHCALYRLVHYFSLYWHPERKVLKIVFISIQFLLNQAPINKTTIRDMAGISVLFINVSFYMIDHYKNPMKRMDLQ